MNSKPAGPNTWASSAAPRSSSAPGPLESSLTAPTISRVAVGHSPKVRPGRCATASGTYKAIQVGSDRLETRGHHLGGAGRRAGLRAALVDRAAGGRAPRGSLSAGHLPDQPLGQ